VRAHECDRHAIAGSLDPSRGANAMTSMHEKPAAGIARRDLLALVGTAAAGLTGAMPAVAQTSPPGPSARVDQKPTVVLERRPAGVLLVGIDRPETQNRIDIPTFNAIGQAYYELEQDDELRVAVLYGKGPDFSRGLDVSSWAPVLASGPFRQPPRFLDPLGTIGPVRSKPVVVAVQGQVSRVAHELFLAADVRVAARDAVFNQGEVTAASFPAGGASVRFPREAGWGNAMRYMLTGDEWHAEEAHRMGIGAPLARRRREARPRDVAARVRPLVRDGRSAGVRSVASGASRARLQRPLGAGEVGRRGDRLRLLLVASDRADGCLRPSADLQPIEFLAPKGRCGRSRTTASGRSESVPQHHSRNTVSAKRRLVPRSPDPTASNAPSQRHRTRRGQLAGPRAMTARRHCIRASNRRVNSLKKKYDRQALTMKMSPPKIGTVTGSSAPRVRAIAPAAAPMAALTTALLTETHTKNSSQATRYSRSERLWITVRFSVAAAIGGESGTRLLLACAAAICGSCPRAAARKSARAWGSRNARSRTSSDPMGVKTSSMAPGISDSEATLDQG